MVTAADIEPHIEIEFGSRLEQLGFQSLGGRNWIRSRRPPIRELFAIRVLGGAQYSPVWGLSSGFVPSFRSGTFRRQSTHKNAVMDLVIDPIDLTSKMPPQAFSLFDPVEQIHTCAEHFIPLALVDFDCVRSIQGFCRFFMERSGLEYRRFAFDTYTQHQLARGFVLLLTGRRDEGLDSIRQFCERVNAEFEDRVLSEYIRHALQQTTA